jgi:hypothetical protein
MIKLNEFGITAKAARLLAVAMRDLTSLSQFA